MKKYLKFLCSILLVTVMVMASAFTGSAQNDEEGKNTVQAIAGYKASAEEGVAIALGFSPVLQNNDFTLFYKAETAETAVYVRKNNEMIYSNPQDIPADASGLSMHRMKSQLYITYYTNNTQAKYYSSFYDCVSYGQNTATVKDNSLVVEYTFGKENLSKEMLPIAIPKDKFENEVLPGLSDEDKETVEAYYELTSVTDAKTDAARKKLIERYKNIEDTDLYALDRYIPDYDVAAVYKALYSNYTNADFIEDNKAAGGTTEIINSSISFTVSLVYSLTDKGLSVALDCSKLTVSDVADIDSITVLEFFGAGSSKDSGFSIIPDGSGGVINFNTDKQWAGAYQGKIFGNDLAVTYTHSDSDNLVQMPVFAIAKKNSGILAVAGEGAELCSIISDIADVALPYNRTAFQANVFAFDKMYVLNPEYGGGTSEVYVRDERPYKKNIVFNYYFMDEGKNSYADFAAYYRNLLIEEGIIGKKLDGKIPFVYGLVGAIDVRKHFLGIPYSGYEVLTSFEQAEDIIQSFSDMGIEEMKVKYSGWFNGGLKQTDISKVKVLSCLGGNKKLSRLMQNEKADIYPEINVSAVSNSLFDAFSVRKDAARTTYDETVLVYPLSLSRNTSDYSANYTYLLSSARYAGRIEKFIKKYNYENVAVLDLASRLNSDFSKKNKTDRTAAKANTISALESLAEKYNVMATAPNSYAWKHVDIMTDMPLGTNDANIFDLKIPFVQMVLAGYVDMACQPINISDNDDGLLDLVAFGTLPNYTLMFAESTAIKDTDYSHLYSLNYEDWQEEAVSLYKAYVADMQKVRGCTVTVWEKLCPDVIRIVYDNGCEFIVNKSSSVYNYGSASVEANTYKFFEGGAK